MKRAFVLRLKSSGGPISRALFERDRLSRAMEVLSLKAIRNDWYMGNSTLPRAILKCITGEKDILFAGFYRQWIPVFEWYGVKWKRSELPKQYMPIFSAMSEEECCTLVDQ